MEQRERLRDLKEKTITVLVFTGIFLPVRLLFYSYVSQWWVGSFGLMTGILLSLMYFSHKKKLGYLGRIINRQVLSFSKGKYGRFYILYLCIWTYFFINAIYGIEFANPELKDRFTEQLASQGVTDLESSVSASENIRFTGPGAWMGPAFGIIITITPNPVGHAMYSIINDFTNGWLLHFVTVFLVEQLEILGLVIYFRWFYK